MTVTINRWLPKIRVHLAWRTLFKATLFALTWYFAPGFLFWLVAALIYMLPVFRPLAVFLPYTATLILAGVVPHAILFAFVLGVLVYLALGIKDLAFLERGDMLEVLCALLLLLATNQILAANDSFADLGDAFLAGVVFFFLGRSLLGYSESGPSPYHSRSMVRIGNALGALLFAEWVWVLLLLPIAPPMATALAFLLGAILLDMLRGYAERKLTRKGALAMTLTMLAVVVLILTSNSWEI